MSFAAPAPEELQPASFAFTPENLAAIERILAKYPPGRQQSAVMPLLDLAQRQHDNWLPRAAMDVVADMLGMPRIKVYEVASFYTMFHLAPVGRWHLQVCTTTPCWLCGSDKVLKAIRERIGIGPGEQTPDGLFSVVEVECLGACVNAPMLQINDDFYEDLDDVRMSAILDALGRGEPPPPGSQTGRRGSQAQAGPTSLMDQAPPEVRQGGQAATAAAARPEQA